MKFPLKMVPLLGDIRSFSRGNTFSQSVWITFEFFWVPLNVPVEIMRV